jgi:predicted transcriptional regulator
MQNPNIKESVKELIDRLPADSNYEDIIAEIYFKQQVEEGLAELDSGKAISHEEVKKRIEKWLK